MGSTVLTLPIFTNEPPRDALWVWLALFFCFKASSIVFTLCHIFFYELCIKHWKIEEGEVHLSSNFPTNTQKIHKKDKSHKTCRIDLQANSQPPQYTTKTYFAPRYPCRRRNTKTVCCHNFSRFSQTSLSPKTRKESTSLFAKSKTWWRRTADKVQQFLKSIFF